MIDDASPLLPQSRATFDALFPLLRPGGEFVLEDWSWAHAPIEVWPKQEPLTSLVAEAVIASAHSPGVVEAIEIDRAWALIRRGPDPIDPDGFSLSQLVGERGRAMVAAMTEAGFQPGGAR